MMFNAKSIACLALTAVGVAASGSTQCTITSVATSTVFYPGATVTAYAEGVTTKHSTVYVTITPTPTPALSARQVNGSPCSSYTTTTSTKVTAAPDPSYTWTITDWATTVTGEPTTVTTWVGCTVPSCGTTTA
ncbi:hypothetical protein BD626DRAFT_512097 [Schizophyllum amplum]|uniref:Uncharacterized protein n=1 Tax=Schizophyllum amplum TaxID=97359 RepID=A0A550C0G1_9AGAR|nr:hypothetical protein BD626DRAFT_512097 [Auriculariopsis ampla]